MDAHANFAVSSVAVAPTPATTGVTLTVAAGEGARFPAVPFNATIAPLTALATPATAEIVRVTARTGDVLTIVRTQEATVARAVQVNDLIAATITAKTITDLETPLVGILGGQVPFPAVQNPSANPNTLDDYAEGTWVPSVGGTATYSAQAGTYTKIGRLVHVKIQLQITALGTGSPSTISGLPFPAVGYHTLPVAYWSGLAGTYVFLAVMTLDGTTTCRVMGAQGAVAALNNPANAMGDGTILFLAGAYSTS